MCCCLPTGCLKKFIYIGLILFLGIGAVLIWAGYEIQNSIFIDLLNYQSAGYVIIACGAGLVLIVFIGFLGVKNDRKVLITIFVIPGIIITLIIIATGAALLYARKISDDYLGTESDCISQFGDAETASDKAAGVICTQYCPCDGKDDYVKAYCASKNTQLFCSDGTDNVENCDPCAELNASGADAATTQEIIQWIQDNLGVTVTSDNCDVTSDQFYDYYFDGYTEYIPLLTWVEEQFDCSGLCTPQALFMFSDINNGEPSGSCRKKLDDYVQEKFLIYGIVSVILGAYMALVMIFTFSVCCCYNNKGKNVGDNTN